LAIEKYGHENITREILFQGKCTREELDKLEVDFITKFNTFKKEGGNGYNLTSGGGSKKVISEETRQKIRDSLKKCVRDKNPRKRAEDQKLDKYISSTHPADGKEGYRVEHPKCKSKSFLSKKDSMEEKLAKAEDFVRKLEAGDVDIPVRIKIEKPKYVYAIKNGWTIRVKDVCVASFQNSSFTVDENMEKVKEHLEKIKLDGTLEKYIRGEIKPNSGKKRGGLSKNETTDKYGEFRGRKTI
jgi:hypothetical protein